jgi:dihydrofolate reductase
MTARDGGNTGNAGAVSDATARDGGNTGNAGAVSSKTSRPRIALVWAMARNRVIGLANGLPWRLPADMARFKALTTGHPVVMGRKTFESLGRPLPNRTNIVVTRDPAYAPPGCLVAHSVEEALQLAARHAANDEREVFVIGGEHLYRQTLPLADRLYVTLVEADVAGDAWFPDFSLDDWLERARVIHPPDDKNAYACTFLTLERKTPRSV